MTTEEFIDEIKRHSQYLQPMTGDLVQCIGNTKDQTIAKCEIAAFIGAILPVLLRKFESERDEPTTFADGPQ